MVQNIEELQADPEIAGFRNRQVEVLHDCQVGVEEVRTPNLIATLTAPAVDGGTELGHRIKTGSVESVPSANYRPSAIVISEYRVTCTDRIIEPVQSAACIVVIHSNRQS